MDDLEETWTQQTFYNQPLSIWMYAQNEFLFEDGTFNLQPVDIFTASNIGDYSYVKQLLKMQVISANAVNKSQWTPLMYAVHNCHEDVAQLLLDNGAYLHQYNEKGLNVLMMAARWGYESLVEKFIKMGSIIEARDAMDWTALFHAVYFNKVEVVQILLKHRSNPNACVRVSGRTPLMFAAVNGNLAMVEALVQAGAFPNFRSVSGHTAEKLASEVGHLHIVAYLSRYRAQEGPSLLEGPVAIEARLSFPHRKKISKMAIQRGAEPLCSSLASDLDTLLTQLGLESYLPLFREQQVDLIVFLSLTDKDLIDCGVTQMGPRRKMTEAISRWHSNAPPTQGAEAAYAFKLGVEMDHLKSQLNELKEKHHKMTSLTKDMKVQLYECHKRCCLIRDSLSSVFRFASKFSLNYLSSDLTFISACVEDIYKLTLMNLTDNNSSLLSS